MTHCLQNLQTDFTELKKRKIMGRKPGNNFFHDRRVDGLHILPKPRGSSELQTYIANLTRHWLF